MYCGTPGTIREMRLSRRPRATTSLRSMSTRTSLTTPRRLPVSRVITWVLRRSERCQIYSDVISESWSQIPGVGNNLNHTEVPWLCSWMPRTWVNAPRAWVTPMVRSADSIIGRRKLTTMNCARSACCLIILANRSTFAPSRNMSTSSKA